MKNMFEAQCGTDIAAHPIAKLLRWDESKLRKLIRLGWLDGDVNSKGEVWVSEYALRHASFIERIRSILAVEVLISLEQDKQVELDFNLILLRILVNQVFRIEDITLKDLEKIISNQGYKYPEKRKQYG